VTVTLDFGPDAAPFVPHHAPTRAAGRGAAWYRGDMHLHTVHSDGRRLPAEVAAAARAGKLDFIVSTDHNTSSAAGVWGDFAGPDLLIIGGEEITTRNGHCTALGLPAGTWIDWRYRAVEGALVRFVQEIHAVGGLAVAAHPLATCVACGWKFGFAGLDAVEVWNGPWTADDEAVVANWDNLLVAGARSGSWIAHRRRRTRQHRAARHRRGPAGHDHAAGDRPGHRDLDHDAAQLAVRPGRGPSPSTDRDDRRHDGRPDEPDLPRKARQALRNNRVESRLLRVFMGVGPPVRCRPGTGASS